MPIYTELTNKLAACVPFSPDLHLVPCSLAAVGFPYTVYCSFMQ